MSLFALFQTSEEWHGCQFTWGTWMCFEFADDLVFETECSLFVSGLRRSRWSTWMDGSSWWMRSWAESRSWSFTPGRMPSENASSAIERKSWKLWRNLRSCTPYLLLPSTPPPSWYISDHIIPVRTVYYFISWLPFKRLIIITLPSDCVRHVWSVCADWWQTCSGCSEGFCVHGPHQYSENSTQSTSLCNEHQHAGELQHYILFQNIKSVLFSIVSNIPVCLGFVKALVSLKRLGKFLCQDELKEENVERIPYNPGERINFIVFELYKPQMANIAIHVTL